MRQILILVLFLPSFQAIGQKVDKLFYTFHLQPEKTYYYDSYDLLNGDLKPGSTSKSTFNFGVGTGVYYELTNKLFVETGIDFISRKLLTKAILNKRALPPPRFSLNDDVTTVNSIALRMLEFPLNFSCRITNKEKMNLYLNAGVAGNLLLNTKYSIGYEGTFWKFNWSGSTLNLGIGSDYNISKNCIINSSITYSVINSVNKDEYLGTESQPGSTLTHKFLKLTLGVKVSNKYIDTLLLGRKYKKTVRENKCKNGNFRIQKLFDKSYSSKSQGM